MSEMIPDIKVRLQVVSWPDDAPRGAVMAFCRKHKVSRAWFYKVRADATAHGQWPAMELASTKPRASPQATNVEMTRLLLGVRAELEAAGWDYGPLSVIAKIRRRGLTPPSRATVARIFSRAGVVIPEPKKKPRSAFRRFVYPAPNCCWQIDATEWLLARSRKVVIFQLIDDHCRLALASLVATGETAEAAIRVVDTAIGRHGVPQKFLSDNGTAFNPSRRGSIGQLVTHLTALGVVPITGKPGKPTTQGKNERVHQTLQQYLRKQPMAGTIAELQVQVDTFDHYYNTERVHQSLPAGTTPHEAWNATPVATAPTPPATLVLLASDQQSTERVAGKQGIVRFRKIRYMIGFEWAGHTIHIVQTATEISFFDSTGTEIINHPRPEPGTDYVGNNKPRGFMASQVSTKP